MNATDHGTATKAVIAAAKSVDKARLKVAPNGMASNAIWDEIERKENRLLRAVEKLAGLKRMSLGIRSSG
jgi:hypothetical protein